jgi:putative membrane protein
MVNQRCGSGSRIAALSAADRVPHGGTSPTAASGRLGKSTEIDASKLATSNSSDKDVKSFAHHMILDHTKLTVQLKMAAPHGVAVPKDNSDTAVLDLLRPLKGADFDKAT